MDIETYKEKRAQAFALVAEKSKDEMRHASAVPNQPYWTHPLNVHNYLIVYGEQDPEILLAAILHDIVEDSDVTVEDLARDFSPKVAETVDLVSKPKNYSPKDAPQFYGRIMASDNEAVMRLKVFDRVDNLLTNAVFHPNKQFVNDYIEEAKTYFMPMAQRVGLESILENSINYLEQGRVNQV